MLDDKLEPAEREPFIMPGGRGRPPRPPCCSSFSKFGGRGRMPVPMPPSIGPTADRFGPPEATINLNFRHPVP